MIKMSQLFELPTVCGALSLSPKLLLRAFLFYPFKKTNRQIAKEMERRITLLLCGSQVGWVKNPEYLIGGSILLSKKIGRAHV
jgi:hypothetical protein